MSVIILLKFLHVVPVIVAVGANLTYVFWLRRAGRDREKLIFAISTIRWLDRRIANPAYILILASGVAMVLQGHFSFETGWIAASIALYVTVAIFGIALFAPAMRRQLAEAERDPATDAYASAAARTEMFGVVATIITMTIVFLMVTKPF
ncbi:MAG: DUF2269 domain-containing protein [Chloroflexota bacterium]|jgi:uncharacterized membrane protein|nr:DUF2269 domain-containing protein [Chloroflexota bacterium]MDH5242567.1 DUF2269 domain-containing protein [Chloroflexota bacterium]